jgi:hypothetical protein
MIKIRKTIQKQPVLIRQATAEELFGYEKYKLIRNVERALADKYKGNSISTSSNSADTQVNK